MCACSLVLLIFVSLSLFGRPSQQPPDSQPGLVESQTVAVAARDWASLRGTSPAPDSQSGLLESQLEATAARLTGQSLYLLVFLGCSKVDVGFSVHVIFCCWGVCVGFLELVYNVCLIAVFGLRAFGKGQI